MDNMVVVASHCRSLLFPISGGSDVSYVHVQEAGMTWTQPI